MWRCGAGVAVLTGGQSPAAPRLVGGSGKPGRGHSAT